MTDAATILTRLPAFLLGIGLHEWAHAYVADRAGDRTPRDMGRLTLNPLKHLDPLGTLCIIFAPFGWGKPVTVMPSQMRDPHQDHMRVALAGPLMNLVIASIGLAAISILPLLPVAVRTHSSFPHVSAALLVMVELNYLLFTLNLIPVPPLDGETIWTYQFGDWGARLMHRAKGWGVFLILVVIFSGLLGFLDGIVLLFAEFLLKAGPLATIGSAAVVTLFFAANAGVVPKLSEKLRRFYQWESSAIQRVMGGRTDWRDDETAFERAQRLRVK